MMLCKAYRICILFVIVQSRIIIHFIFINIFITFLTILSVRLFLHLQFTYSNYLSTSHDLSHSHSHILGSQINPSSHLSLSIKSLHSHLHLSLFKRCLSLQPLHLIHIYMQNSHAKTHNTFY